MFGLATERLKDHEQSHATCKIKNGDNKTSKWAIGSDKI
jgi:hypothetical protein